MNSRKNEELLTSARERYLMFKSFACTEIRNILETKEDILTRLTRLSEESHGIIEVAQSHGDADSGKGRYTAHLVLSLNAFNKRRFDSLVSLDIGYVLPSEHGQAEHVCEFAQLESLDFLNILILLEYMRRLCHFQTATGELDRLSRRKSAGCSQEGRITFE